MTDYDGPPLTRRERKERERAAAEATGAHEPVVAPAEQAPTDAVEAPADAAVAAPAAGAPAADEHDAIPAAVEADAAPVAADEAQTHAEDSRVAPAEEAASDETQAIDVSELIADLKHSAPSAPDPLTPAPEPTADADPRAEVDAIIAAPEVSDPPAPTSSSSGFGRFFGRRPAVASEAQATVEPTDEAPEVEARLEEPRAPVEEPPALVEPVREPLVAPAPAATTSSMPRIEVENLDAVDDAELDRLEIDEVVVEGSRVSSRRVAESTPAELEDRREDAQEIDSPTGPTRGTGRMPVVVNVVEDTSEHHIADLRGGAESSALSASSVGTGTSAITANALVLPASGAHDPITVETSEGVIVTGSIDLPDGFASSGRGRGSIDTSDLDGDDVGEVRSPETQPVRASRAVSSYANARVRIAPQRRSRNAWPIVLGVGGGVVTAGIVTVAAAFIFNWI